MACGLPVIATRHSGFPDQVVDGLTGLLVPEGDWRALAEVICELIERPERWASMGHEGRKHIQQKYDNEKIMDEQIKIYDELLKR